MPHINLELLTVMLAPLSAKVVDNKAKAGLAMNKAIEMAGITGGKNRG